MSFHWRDFLWKISTSRSPGRKRRNGNIQSVKFDSSESEESAENSNEDDDQSEHVSDDSSGISGHYSFQHNKQRQDWEDNDERSSSSEEESHGTMASQAKEEDESQWREKFEFMLSLIREPRYLLSETLVAEQLKLTLKKQAFQLERTMLLKTIQEHRRRHHHQSRKGGGDEEAHQSIGADIESLHKQLRIVDQRLSTLTGKLEVLRAVQQALPTARAPGVGDSDEPDSLEETSQTAATTAIATSSSVADGTIRSLPETAAATGDTRDLLALLRLERLAQKATRRDYEALRKQNKRLKEELEWRDSGQGDDDFGDSVFSSGDRDRDSDSVQMKPSVALKSWTTWQSTHSRQSGVTTTIRRHHRHRHNREDNSGSTCSSLESLATSEQLWNELQARDRTIVQLRSKISQLEPLAASSRAEADQLNMINKELERKNEELQMIINNLTANVEALKTYQLVEQQKENDKTFISSDENIQRKRTYKVNENKEFIQMRGLIAELQQKENEYKAKIEQLERVLRQSNSLPEVPNLEELERHVNHVEQELEEKDKQLSALENYLAAKEEECMALRLDLETVQEENARLKQELNEALFRDKQETDVKLDEITMELNLALEANKRLLEDINRERVLRKKYFNTIEDLKGKIRVYCRLRPLTSMEQRAHQNQTSFADVVDPYTLVINPPSKGAKEFHFDRVFSPYDTQETVFEDTHTLVQSAFDGYNVCICAYGQTGSGKTHTIIGDENEPGLAPRTFQRIFQLAAEHQAQFDVQVSCSMLELYNDRLIDLIRGDHPELKLEIKKDKRGIVWVQGAQVVTVKNAGQLSELFRRGLQSRHTGSTRMNDRSSRSHLIVSINIICTSRLHGTVLTGKVSLLDLAGSERITKSGATGDQLKEASAINKSLSTLGDVISALASDQQHTPYRNSKLTMLMQDSLGGNAKTLLFVTASIAQSNLDETLTSLTYASRAKEVTNTAQRNQDSREIARLKAIIQKLRRGEEDCESEPLI